ncbi:hypothetical protein BV22DRAFT_990737, partial [Leucogyrophana mollusca]
SIRITKQGKMRNWVKHALNFFQVWGHLCCDIYRLHEFWQDNPGKLLTLQTSSSDVTTSALPRLISVVEIIKREYLKNLVLSTSNLSGLHQYNRLLCEERLEDHGEDRADALPMALEGRNQCVVDAWDDMMHPKQSFAPCLKITLSVKPLPGKLEKGMTYQSPEMRRLSKTAKARIRKKEKE